MKDVDKNFEEINKKLDETHECQERIEAKIDANSKIIAGLAATSAAKVEDKKGILELKKVALMGGLPIGGSAITLILQKVFNLG